MSFPMKILDEILAIVMTPNKIEGYQTTTAIKFFKIINLSNEIITSVQYINKNGISFTINFHNQLTLSDLY